jgi:hypothetical protein
MAERVACRCRGEIENNERMTRKPAGNGISFDGKASD